MKVALQDSIYDVETFRGLKHSTSFGVEAQKYYGENSSKCETCGHLLSEHGQLTKALQGPLLVCPGNALLRDWTGDESTLNTDLMKKYLVPIENK